MAERTGDYSRQSTPAEFKDWFNSLIGFKKGSAIGAIALGAIMIGGSTHDGLTQTVRYDTITCSGSDSFETPGSIGGDDLLGQIADEMQISAEEKPAFTKIIADRNGMTFLSAAAIPEGTTINVPEHCS